MNQCRLHLPYLQDTPHPRHLIIDTGQLLRRGLNGQMEGEAGEVVEEDSAEEVEDSAEEVEEVVAEVVEVSVVEEVVADMAEDIAAAAAVASQLEPLCLWLMVLEKTSTE